MSAFRITRKVELGGITVETDSLGGGLEDATSQMGLFDRSNSSLTQAISAQFSFRKSRLRYYCATIMKEDGTRMDNRGC